MLERNRGCLLVVSIWFRIEFFIVTRWTHTISLTKTIPDPWSQSPKYISQRNDFTNGETFHMLCRARDER